jgi:hypothetical protein
VVEAQLEHLRADEALDEPEHVRVGAALDLAGQAPLGPGEEREVADPREAVGQELLREVQLPAADHVAVDLPGDALRDVHAPGIAVDVAVSHFGLHDFDPHFQCPRGPREPRLL